MVCSTNTYGGPSTGWALGDRTKRSTVCEVVLCVHMHPCKCVCAECVWKECQLEGVQVGQSLARRRGWEEVDGAGPQTARG